MHPNKTFQEHDPQALYAFLEDRGFGTLVMMTAGGLKGASIPFVVDAEAGALRFHLSRGNALVETLTSGAHGFLTVNGPDAYISPDWYADKTQVPTWNYVAVHLQGDCNALPDDALPQLLDDLSAMHEGRLAPKTPWTRDKLAPEKDERMRRVIQPFVFRITSMEGTWKLSQNKSEADREGAINGLQERGDTGSIATAMLM